jgi:predicted MFS family arabinose efflux permease
VGGLLTENFGWRSIFWLTVILSIIAIAGLLWKLKGEWAEAKGEKFDVSGSIIYGLSLVCLIYGFSRLPEQIGIWLTAAGIIGTAVFIRWEIGRKSPILNMDLFRKSAVFTFSNIAALINYSATFAVTFLLSLYLQYNQGLSPQNAGLVLVAMPAMQAAFSPLAGRMSDRIASSNSLTFISFMPACSSILNG